MISKLTPALIEDDLLVSLTFHNFSSQMLIEFAEKIVKPYFGGNMNEAIRCLMGNALAEETLLKKTMRKKA